MIKLNVLIPRTGFREKNFQIDPPRKVFEILTPKLSQRCPHVYFTCPRNMEVIAAIFSEYALTKVGGNPKNTLFVLKALDFLTNSLIKE